MRSLVHILSAILIWMMFGTVAALAQSATPSEDEEKSSLIRYVEEQISTDDFQIRLNGLRGALSSDVALSSITIADSKGVWLTITEPRLVWNRSALLVGRVEIDSLTAQSITMDRKPSAHFELTVLVTKDGPEILTPRPRLKF